MSNLLSKSLAGTRSPASRCEVKECLVLQYHRVALLSHDPLRLAVQPCNFERQMEYLATSFNVISMDELKQHLATATPFRIGTVAVTFDGGYSDVLYTAKEVLDRFEIPATVFVTSASLVERTQFWWDTLEDVLIAGAPPDPLTVEIDGEPHGWPLATQHDRFRAFDELYAILSCKGSAQQVEVIAEIRRSLGGPRGDCDGHAALSVDELRRLEEGGLITVGGHTHHGVKLSALPEWEQVREIGRNKQALEEVLGHRIEYFAYPFGDEDGPTAVTRRILKGFGFTLSCHARSDTVSVTGATSPYELPRLKVRDWNPFTFYRCLKTFLG
jgi:peptidoglycan/xylan/chitin deacetylase (PgdA/CDA1 family)